MRFESLPSYERSLRKLDRETKSKVKEAVNKYVDFFEGGHRPKGLGLRKLTRHIWEIRVDLKMRVIFRFEEDLVLWGLVGSHDDIKRVLKHFK